VFSASTELNGDEKTSVYGRRSGLNNYIIASEMGLGIISIMVREFLLCD